MTETLPAQGRPVTPAVPRASVKKTLFIILPLYAGVLISSHTHSSDELTTNSLYFQTQLLKYLLPTFARTFGPDAIPLSPKEGANAALLVHCWR